jgi:hypothetical protein
LVAALGVLICAVQIAQYIRAGGWPLHDTADYWLAGRHLLEGAPVYASNPNGYLIFTYSPPWAVIWAPISILPLDIVCILLLGLQIAALRYVVGSWIAVGVVAWLPVVPRELMTGNVDFLICAAILAGIRGAGWPVVLASFAKFAPAIILLRARTRQRSEALIAGLVLIAVTIPWWPLWGQWLSLILSNPPGTEDVIPAVIRVPIALALLTVRSPWAVATAAGLLTPSFHVHTPVMLLPGLRLWWEAHPRASADVSTGPERMR